MNRLQVLIFLRYHLKHAGTFYPNTAGFQPAPKAEQVRYAELGLHPDTVRAALEVERFQRGPAPRAALTNPYLEFIGRTLLQHPRLRATRLFEMLRDRGYRGSVVQLRRVVAALRPPAPEAFLRLATLPGEQAQANRPDCSALVSSSSMARRNLKCVRVIGSENLTQRLERK